MSHIASSIGYVYALNHEIPDYSEFHRQAIAVHADDLIPFFQRIPIFSEALLEPKELTSHLIKAKHTFLQQIHELSGKQGFWETFVWFQRYFNGIRTALRKHLPKSSNWKQLWENLQASVLQAEKIEEHLALRYDDLASARGSIFALEIQLDRLYLEILIDSSRGQSAYIRSFLELLVDNFNLLNIVRSDLIQGQDEGYRLEALLFQPEGFSSEAFQYQGLANSNDIFADFQDELQQFGIYGRELVDFEKYTLLRQMEYVNQADFRASADLSFMQLLKRSEIFFHNAQLLVASVQDVQRLQRLLVNYDYI